MHFGPIILLAATLLAGCAGGSGGAKGEVEAVVTDEKARAVAADAAAKGADTETSLEAGQAAKVTPGAATPK